MLVLLAIINQPLDNNNPTITEYWYAGITIIFLSCLVCLPHPTPDGRFLPQTTKSVQDEILNFFFAL